jgi:hypothetical protein
VHFIQVSQIPVQQIDDPVIVIREKRIAENLSNAFISGEQAPGNRRLFLVQVLCFKKTLREAIFLSIPSRCKGGRG